MRLEWRGWRGWMRRPTDRTVNLVHLVHLPAPRSTNMLTSSVQPAQPRAVPLAEHPTSSRRWGLARGQTATWGRKVVVTLPHSSIATSGRDRRLSALQEREGFGCPPCPPPLGTTLLGRFAVETGAGRRGSNSRAKPILRGGKDGRILFVRLESTPLVLTQRFLVSAPIMQDESYKQEGWLKK